jgi:hypothetical protein
MIHFGYVILGMGAILLILFYTIVGIGLLLNRTDKDK